jgi:hypothetical protein
MPRLLGNGPLEITSRFNGKQYLVPLTALAVDSSGQVTISWPSFSSLPKDDQDALKQLAQAQLGEGVLSPDTAGPPQAAVVVKAVETGTAGNDIQVRFTNFVLDRNTPANTTFDTTVTETDVYALLSIDSGNSNFFVGNVLGTGTTTAPSKPGLVRVKAMGSSTNAPAQANYWLDPSAGGKVDVKDAANAVVFTLEARRSRTSATPLILVQIAAGADAKTFALTASISLSRNVKPADLLTVTDFDQFVTFAAPAGASAVGVPAQTSVQLTGGAPAADATNAEATVLTGTS